MSAIGLVGLDDEIVGAGPCGTDSKVGDIATNDETWPTSGFVQREHQHGRGCGLAVGAGNPYRMGLCADGGENLSAVHGRDPTAACLVKFV